MSLSEYWARRLLRASLDIEALPAVGASFLALLTLPPPRAVTGAQLPELTYDGYVRTGVPTSAWTEFSPYEYINTNDLPLAPNTGSQPQVALAFALCTAETGGNVTWIGRMPGFELHPDDPDPRIPSGALHLVLPASA